MPVIDHELAHSVLREASDRHHRVSSQRGYPSTMSTAVPHEAEAHRSGGYPNQYNNNQNPGWFRKHPLLATAVWLLDWRSPHGELR